MSKLLNSKITVLICIICVLSLFFAFHRTYHPYYPGINVRAIDHHGKTIKYEKCELEKCDLLINNMLLYTDGAGSVKIDRIDYFEPIPQYTYLDFIWGTCIFIFSLFLVINIGIYFWKWIETRNQYAVLENQYIAPENAFSDEDYQF